MGRPNGNAALYAVKLRKAMKSCANPDTGHPWTVRGLGKATDPANLERGRRRVQRHLTGRYMPTRASQQLYADVLGDPELAPSDDEEEEALNRDLMRGIRAARSRLAELERTLREEVRV